MTPPRVRIDRPAFQIQDGPINPLDKIANYARSAAALGSLNLRGLPLIPKSVWPSVPSNRSWFNQFVLWIDQLQLRNVRQVVDVGANHGDFSQAASALFPTAQVLLVEPLPALHDELRRRCSERAGRWSLAPFALSSERGTGTLFVDQTQDGISSLAGFSDEYLRAFPAARPSANVACEIRTLDNLCTESGIEMIDLLKIDVEGFEFEVLEGAREMLKRTTAMVVEVSLIRRIAEGDALERICRLLRENNFHLVALYPACGPEEPWRPLEFNILARHADADNSPTRSQA
jgi:FkbM family methyltransferase